MQRLLTLILGAVAVFAAGYAFRQDPAWIKAREESENSGKIAEKVESVFLDPTDFSPMK